MGTCKYQQIAISTRTMNNAHWRGESQVDFQIQVPSSLVVALETMGEDYSQSKGKGKKESERGK